MSFDIENAKKILYNQRYSQIDAFLKAGIYQNTCKVIKKQS